jgi:hypothetical protein
MLSTKVTEKLSPQSGLSYGSVQREHVSGMGCVFFDQPVNGFSTIRCKDFNETTYFDFIIRFLK